MLELMVVAAVITVLAGAFVIPSYRSYQASRAPLDAAQRLAQDLAVLERAAQNGVRNEGATLVVVSADPLIYRCYRGRPESINPNSALGAMIVERRFPSVALTGEPIGVTTPLLFASDGTAQYVSSGLVSDPHTTIDLTINQRPAGTNATVTLDLLTGAVSVR